MPSISQALPIDVAISAAYGTVQDDATADLRNVISDIDANSKKKESLRQIQEQLTIAKQAQKNAKDQPSFNKAAGELERLNQMLGQTGYDSSTPLGRSAADRPNETKYDANGDGNLNNDPGWWHFNPGNDGVQKAYEGYFEAIETQLKSEMDRHSDISSKLQVEMNTKSSILRRSEQGVSDNENAFQKLKEGIQRNYKG